MKTRTLAQRARRKDNGRVVKLISIAKVYAMRKTVVYVTVDVLDGHTTLICESELIF